MTLFILTGHVVILFSRYCMEFFSVSDSVRIEKKCVLTTVYLRSGENAETIAFILELCFMVSTPDKFHMSDKSHMSLCVPSR